MSNLRDITGMIFGDWKVIEFDNTKGKYKYYWICKCINCDNIKSIASSSLLDGKSNKCNKCNNTYGKIKNIKGYAEDLTGNKYGELVVIGYSHKKHSHSFWNCKCSCGNYDIFNVTQLKNGKVLKCRECSKKEKENIKNELYIEKQEESTKKFKDKIINRKKYNNYTIKNEIVIIDDELIISIEDLEKVKSINRAWYKNKSGYWLVTKNNEDIFLHRFLMDLPNRYDEKTKLIVDHINGNRNDNRRCNLRVIQKEINPINCKIYSNNTSGQKGVSYLKRLNKWQVNINVNKKSIYLGVYSDFDEAVRVRKEAEKKYFGEYNRE